MPQKMRDQHQRWDEQKCDLKAGAEAEVHDKIHPILPDEIGYRNYLCCIADDREDDHAQEQRA